MKIILAIIFYLCMLLGSLFAQAPFQGSITYELSYLMDGQPRRIGFMPEGYVVMVRGDNLKVNIIGEQAIRVLGHGLIRGNDSIAYLLNPDQKAAFQLDLAALAVEQGVGGTEMQKFDDTLSVLGYGCQLVKVNMEMDGEEMIHQLWVADSLKLPAVAMKYQLPIAGELLRSGLKHFPLRLESQIMARGISIDVLARAISIDTDLPPQQEFEVPEGYEQKEMDMSLFGQ